VQRATGVTRVVPWPLTMVDDSRALVRAWAAGDRTAADQFARQHFDLLWRYFRTKIPDVAEDAIQSVFASCTQYLDRLCEARNVRAYVLQIARHELYARLRHARRDFDPARSSLADLGPSPSTLVGREEEERRVLAAMQRLPLQQQEVLELYYWEDMNTVELAEVFEIPEATARRRLQRARARLRTELDDPALETRMTDAREDEDP
jgi:RNA polymerase sigma factor (sigma-70 family)